MEPRKVDPIEYIKSEMERRGLKRKDLMPVFGTRARTSDVFTKRRRLSLRMIRALHNDFHMSAEKLIGEYELTAGKK